MVDKQFTAIRRLAIGEDITGDGTPNLVLEEDTRGAHCCYAIHLLQLGKKFRHLGTFDTAHGPHGFINYDHLPGLELFMHDWTFAYWRSGFARSPAPLLLFRYHNGAYRLAPELMWQPAPVYADLMAQAIASAERSRPYP